MMKIMERITLPVIFPTTVAGGRREKEVHAVPEEVERRHLEVKGWKNTRKVVEMFDRMHTDPTEGVGIDVAVMKRVNIFVKNTDVNEPVGKIKVNL